MKETTDVKEWQRCVTRLTMLDGQLIHCSGGAYLFHAPRLRDVGPIVQACRSGALPDVRAIVPALVNVDPPIAVTPMLLAAAHHDLKRLERAIAARTIQREAPRLARKHQLDARWLDERSERIAELSRERVETHRTWTALDSRLPQWLDRALFLIAELHGKRSAHVVAYLANAIARRTPDKIRSRREVLAELAACVRRRAADHAERSIGIAALQILDEVNTPGRARARRVRKVISALLGIDAPSLPISDVASLPLEEQVKTIGATLIDRAPDATVHDVTRLAEALAEWALLFPADLEIVSEPDVHTMAAELGVARRLAGQPLQLAQAVRIARLDVVDSLAGRIGAWIADGLALSSIEAAAAVGPLQPLEGFRGDARDVQAWCHWVALLVPHYRSMGLKLDLPVGVIARLRIARDEDLAVLLHCLMSARKGERRASLDASLQLLGTTLGLFAAAPTRAHALLASLDGTTPGLGARLHPEFASWLGAGPLLDRYLHLCVLAGAKTDLPRPLVEDFRRAEKMRNQLAHLRAAKHPSEKQKKHILKLLLESNASDECHPGRTRRRIADRIPELLQRAFDRKLDELLCLLIKETTGIALKSLSPSWRDAIQFHMTAEDNRSLLQSLLRFAASQPGRPIAPTLPRNQEWLARAAARMNVPAWMQRRGHDVEIAGRRFTVHTEEDPLQILRMGIPFNTCLSLDDGCNAASTVINALDVNKRVLYVRDESGSIVARKLIAVSKTWKLIGYHCYASISGSHAKEAERHLLELCGAIAQECGLELSAAGEPEQIHEGFWYDDGTVPFTARAGTDVDVSRYCSHLGRPVPERGERDLAEEARLWSRLRKSDIRALVPDLGKGGLLDQLVGNHVVSSLGVADSLRLARAHGALLNFAGVLAARDSEAALSRAINGAPPEQWQFESMLELLVRFNPSAKIARVLVDAAGRCARNSAQAEDAALQSMWLVLPHLDEHSLVELFDTIDRFEPVARWLAERGSWYATAIADWPKSVATAAARVFARRPDVRCLVEALASRNRTLLARRVALHVLAATTVDGQGVERSLRRALAVLSRDDDSARRSAAMYAARCRHCPGDLAGDEDVDGNPLEILGPASLDLPIHLVARWLELPRDLAVWAPGPWTLACLRRHRGSAHRQLVRAAAADGHGWKEALTWLGALGADDVLRELLTQWCRDPQMTSRTAFLNQQLRTANAIRRQLQTGTVEPSVEVSAVDAIVVHRTCGALLRAGAPMPVSDFELAAAALRDAPLTSAEARLLLDALLPQLNGLPEAAKTLVNRLLDVQPQGADALAVARAWPHPSLRARCAGLLRRRFNRWADARQALRSAEAAGAPAVPLEELTPLWFSTPPDHDLTTLGDDLDEVRPQVARMAPCLDVAQWLQVYRGQSIGMDASTWLEGIAHISDGKRAQLRSLARSTEWKPNEASLRLWLEEALGKQPQR